MKTKRKAAQPPVSIRPVRIFDRAVSQITGHLKSSEPRDALQGVKKALALKNLSEAQRSVLYLLSARANLLMQEFGKARYDLDMAGRFNGWNLNVRHTEIMQLSGEIQSLEHPHSNSWKPAPHSPKRERTWRKAS